MREVVLRQGKSKTETAVRERLVRLLAIGLERLVEKERREADAVDFGADESVTTDCPDDGAGEDHKT